MQEPEDSRPDQTPAEYLASKFHEAYESLAPSRGYDTRPDSRTAWESVPEPNKGLMIATAQKLLDDGVIQIIPREDSPNWTGVTDAMRAELEQAQQQIDEHHKRHKA